MKSSIYLVFVAFVTWVCLPLAAVAEETADSDWTLEKTPWGDPDLEGVWSNATITPFERRAAQADQEFLTEEEVEEAEGRMAARMAAGDEPAPPKTEPPEKGGNVGAYNFGWMDLGTKVVKSRRTSLVIDPPNGRVPVRAAAEEHRDHAREQSGNDFEHMSPWDRCISRGIPGGMFPAGYNNYYRILQTPGYVVILYEMIHEARIIPVDGRPRLGEGVEYWNGEPRGRWEGDTLVVETVNFTDRGWIATSGSQGRVKGVPQTRSARIVERFTRVDEGTIEWTVTVEDPEIYTSAWTVANPLVANPDVRLYEYACHEGNQAVGNILRGARVQEREP